MILKKHQQVVSILTIVAAIYFSFYSLTPNFKNESKSLTEFSNDKALGHLKEISKKPHYTGSAEHNVVRNYLVNQFEKLGLIVEVQEQLVISKKRRVAVNTRNIVVKIKGAEAGKALLLLSHYDSSPHSSLGASDAGSGVAIILEGIRTYLAKKIQPKNDIIICITDAEELGLLGANAFVNHHRWAKDVGLVLNFEARGSGGPSYMLLETNGGNKKLIEAFQKANTSNPAANSLMYSVYKMLPNDTDLTVFREDGNIEGFNFAFIGDHFDYHTEQDSFERIDLNTFQHQVSYLMGGLNYFADADLDNLKSDEDYIYFNFPYLGLVFYPFSWVAPMFVICVLLFLGLLFYGFLKRKLTLKGILKGFVPLLLSLLLSSLIAIYGWKLILKIHPLYSDILHGFTYNGYLYIAVFVAFTLSICFWFYKGFFKKRTSQDLIIAPIFLWLLINGGVVFYLKGAGFFIIPVIFLLLILALLLAFKQKREFGLFFTFLAIPILIIFTPLIKIFPVGLGLKMLIVSTVFTVLIFGLLIPIFQQYRNRKKLASLFFLIGAVALISASIQSTFTEERKKPNSILYVLDATNNKAYWASYSENVDGFTKQFLGKGVKKGDFESNILPSKYNSRIKLYSNTNVRPLLKPEITILKDTIVGNDRKVRFSINSLRDANKIDIISKEKIQLKSFKVNGEDFKSQLSNNNYVLSLNEGRVLSYFRTKESELIELEMVAPKEQLFNFEILEAKFDLFSNPLFKLKPRSKEMMPTPFVLNDATVIKTAIKF